MFTNNNFSAEFARGSLTWSLTVGVSVLTYQMQHRENSQMKALAEEWKKRDKERELMVKKKVKQ